VVGGGKCIICGGGLFTKNPDMIRVPETNAPSHLEESGHNAQAFYLLTVDHISHSHFAVDGKGSTGTRVR